MKHHKNNRIKPRYLLFALLAVGCLCLGFSYKFGTGAGPVQKTIGLLIIPMEKGINNIGEFFSNLSKDASDLSKLQEENAQLKSENEALEAKLSSMENNLSELSSLRELLKLREKYPTYDMIGARIISKDAGNWYNNFTIDRGSLDGIRVDANVIANNGLVGIVTEVGLNYSIVRAIIDDSSSVSGMLSKSNDLCFVNGNLQLMDEGLVDVEFISMDADILDGDLVVTSYVSDLFLPGLPIGYISNAEADESNLTQNAKLTPIVDFQHVSDVLVITQLKSEITSSATGASSQASDDDPAKSPQSENQTDSTETQQSDVLE